MGGVSPTGSNASPAQPTPLLRTAAAAHVVAALALVRGNFAARAALARVLDEAQRRFFRRHVFPRPLRARLEGMRITMREAIDVTALALDAGIL